MEFIINSKTTVSHSDRDFVDLRKFSPSIQIELRYSTIRNGVNEAIYPLSAKCLLRRGVAIRLLKVQKLLEHQGYGLKIWDAYRPLSAQNKLWQVCPDPRFVAPPRRGSRHNRGTAVDLTLVDKNGKEIKMPSDFDSFRVNARSDYSGGSLEARRMRDLLRSTMQECGFIADRNEWWHFSDPQWKQYKKTNISF